MKQYDLTNVKQIGASRKKLLKSFGITTIEQLHEIPLEKLAGIKSIGNHYAKLIKGAVTEHYEKELGKEPGKTSPAKKKKIEKTNSNFQKNIKQLINILSRVDEDLKSLSEKKYLELYADFEKRSNKLKFRLQAIDKINENLPGKVKKNIIKKAGAVIVFLKKVGTKPKKKKYKKITREIRSFSRILRDAIPDTEIGQNRD